MISSLCCKYLKACSDIIYDSRGTPGAQSSSLYALCGLACSLLCSSLGDKLQATAAKHLSAASGNNISWLSKVVDTFLLILDSNYEPQDTTFNFCRVGSGKAMSAMARAASALCLAELSPWIYKHYFSIFQSVIGLLVKFTATRKQSVLPENPGTSQMTSPVRSSCGLALGIVLDKLVRYIYVNTVRFMSQFCNDHLDVPLQCPSK
jgi:hypothetical protein